MSTKPKKKRPIKRPPRIALAKAHKEIDREMHHGRRSHILGWARLPNDVLVVETEHTSEVEPGHEIMTIRLTTFVGMTKTTGMVVDIEHIREG